jgi:hypothetical protein
VTWDRLLWKNANRWTILALSVAAGLLAVEILSRRPLSHIIVSYLTLEPASGWARINQWTFGWPNVERHWLFGLGFQDWSRPIWMSYSVDSYWLHNAIKFGMVGLALISAATLLALLWVVRARLPVANERLSRAREAWMFTAISVALVGITVDYWQQMNAYYFFLLGSGIWIAEFGVGSLARKPCPVAEADRPITSNALIKPGRGRTR